MKLSRRERVLVCMRTVTPEQRPSRMRPGTDDPDTAPGEDPHRVVDLEERTWLPRHLNGDREAFPALINAYRRPVYSYLVRAGIDAGERDDIFQNIFLKIHRAAASYQPARPLRPWLFVIAANTVRNHVRDRRGMAEVLTAVGPETPEPATPDPDPERVTAGREAVAWLESAITELPFAQRQALLLVCVNGLSQQDAAAALDVPLNTLKTQLRRARLTLAKAMAERERQREGETT